MARKMLVQYVDDVDGSLLEEGVGETVRFGLDANDYEIDLSPEHARELRAALENYVAAGRRVQKSGGTGRTTALPKTGPSRDLTAVRKWAKANGFDVSDRGRVPLKVLEAFDAAN